MVVFLPTPLTLDFGAFTALEVRGLSVRKDLAHMSYRTRIVSALIRNSSGGYVDVVGSSRIETGERKRVDFPGGADYLYVTAEVVAAAGTITADLELDVV